MYMPVYMLSYSENPKSLPRLCQDWPKPLQALSALLVSLSTRRVGGSEGLSMYTHNPYNPYCNSPSPTKMN